MQRTVTDAETSRDVIANRRPKTYIRVSGWLWDNLETICQVCVLATGARVAFLGRNAAIGADGLSYLDVASAYLQHNWQTAVNGYWSPLYSWLLGVAMFLVKPSASLEPLLVRGVNFLIFALAVYTFRDCWHALASWSRRGQPGTTIAEVAPKGWILFGYALFVATVPWHVESVAPDILVAVVVFATSTLLFKMNDGRRGIAADISLGIVLAIGYYAKAILLYFAIFVILTLLLRRKSNRRLGTVVTITIFSMLVLPYVFALSHTLGRWTAGDSGKLNYAWFVDGSPTKSWMIPHGAPLPFFPGPQIASNVPAFRVPVLPGVTYAPWYDAARFATGSQPRFSLRGEIRQVAINLRELQFDLLITGAPLLVTLLVFLSYSPRSSLSRLLSSWIFWLPPLAVLSMQLLVHLVSRFTLGFIPVLWGITLSAAVIPTPYHPSAKRTILVGALVFAMSTLPGLAHSLWSNHDASAKTDVSIAQALPDYGVHAGDLVASVGTGEGAYWARLSRVSIVAETWDENTDGFFDLPRSSQETLLRKMSAAGARAVIWHVPPNP